MKTPKEKPVGCRCKKCGYFGPQFPSQITPLTQCPACGHRGFSEEVGVIERQEREITNLRSRLADAQARAEKAEAALKQSQELHDFFFERSKSLEASLELARKDIQIRQARAERAEDREQALRKHLMAYADESYCDSLRQFRQTQCLGWEAKVRMGLFGEAEMKAHQKANEAMGAHRGIYAALREFEALAPAPQGRTDGERLDWLEENANDTPGLTIGGVCTWSVYRENERLGEGDDLRDAINDAMDATAPEVKGGAA